MVEVDDPRHPLDTDGDGTPDYADMTPNGGVESRGGGCGIGGPGAMENELPAASAAVILLALAMLLQCTNTSSVVRGGGSE